MRTNTQIAKSLGAIVVCTVAMGMAPFAAHQRDTDFHLVRLGRSLFFDRELSADRTISCASCHQQEHGWTSPDKLSRGVGDCVGKRHVPSLYNVASRKHFFWDGRETLLETAVIRPVQDACEMDLPMDALIERLESKAKYQVMFSSAELAIDTTGIGQALAAFCRTIIADDAPLDRYRAGDAAALSPAARRGHDLFYFRLNCGSCHTGRQLSDGKFHNLGIGFDASDPDLGRFLVTGEKDDRGAFRTPSLRNVSKTAPYMHDGRFQSLEQVLEFYKQGGHYNSNLDPLINLLPLDDTQSADLIAFLMEGLTSESDPAAEAMAADELGD